MMPHYHSGAACCLWHGEAAPQEHTKSRAGNAHRNAGALYSSGPLRPRTTAFSWPSRFVSCQTTARMCVLLSDDEACLCAARKAACAALIGSPAAFSSRAASALPHSEGLARPLHVPPNYCIIDGHFCQMGCVILYQEQQGQTGSSAHRSRVCRPLGAQ
jgi:hypothetical protein